MMRSVFVLDEARLRAARQMRRIAVLRSVNFRTGVTPGSSFQISTKQAADQFFTRAASSVSFANLSRLPARSPGR